jgi:glycosyltransferase involved in cell wall biosynthesis
VGGVSAYVAQFVPALLDLAPHHRFFLYADRKRPFELQTIPANTTVRLLPYRTPVSSVYNDFFMWREMAKDRLDIAHFPANYGFGPRSSRVVITVHDSLNLIPLRRVFRGRSHPRRPRTLAMMMYLHFCTVRAISRASLLITVSSHARNDIAQEGGFDRRRIVIVPHAPASDLRRVTDPHALASVRQRHGLGKPFVMADALKNPATLLDAWRLLPDDLTRGREIVFFSRHANPPSVVSEAVQANETRLLINPSREDLIALLSMADAFVFPSWIEGFGLPLLEAMICGAPIVASDRGAIPEVVGDAGLLADAKDSTTFARHLESIFRSPEVASCLRHKGFERARQFSWQSTARQILDAYLMALSDQPTNQP